VLVDDAGDAVPGVLFLLLSALISFVRLVFFNFDRAPDKKEDSFTSTSSRGDDLLGLPPVLRITGAGLVVLTADELAGLFSTGEVTTDRKTGFNCVGATENVDGGLAIVTGAGVCLGSGEGIEGDGLSGDDGTGTDSCVLDCCSDGEQLDSEMSDARAPVDFNTGRGGGTPFGAEYEDVIVGVGVGLCIG